ncbi:MAG TPA: DUF411 domain-containing protein [Ottowia sp.]|uniref:DUF411 domain-containing protein n=1 Tax=Ottowia sp. TaxID=1898956 RepID=UPI002C0F7C09|nr:DUF411 domain-containing protein [Ottowia sp.]HMN21333.1 DUF411 domain-containing protein [Ottowia sp.]
MNTSDPVVPARRGALQWGAGALAAVLLAPLARAQRLADAHAVEVWKDASCGCCNDWIAHMTQHGFEVTAHDTGNNAVRARLGLAAKYGSCHTALVGGYVVEGHVHADDVRRLLRERPQALGLTVPGMPIGSPGMDGPAYGGKRDRYDTLLVLRDGSSRVFRRHA